jgi:hypothetical protein
MGRRGGEGRGGKEEREREGRGIDHQRDPKRFQERRGAPKGRVSVGGCLGWTMPMAIAKVVVVVAGRQPGRPRAR